MKLALARIFALGAAALGLAACGPDYDRTELEFVSSSFPAIESASRSKITITHGSLMVIRVVVWNDEDEKMPLRLQMTTGPTTGRGSNGTVATIRAVENQPESYALTGTNLGAAQLEIIADDDRVLTINVEVIAQPPPPES